jgi:16S rRNA processing protein RimM
MGRVAAPFGVKGWLKVAPLSADPLALVDHANWFFKAPAAGDWIARSVEEVREHSGKLVAKIAGVDSREAAQALRGLQVALPRDDLPAPADDEIYIADLAGLRVINREGIELGQVQDVQESGAHPLLRVVAQDGRARLIPYVEAMIDSIDRDARTISVDWGADY